MNHVDLKILPIPRNPNGLRINVATNRWIKKLFVRAIRTNPRIRKILQCSSYYTRQNRKSEDVYVFVYSARYFKTFGRNQ